MRLHSGRASCAQILKPFKTTNAAKPGENHETTDKRSSHLRVVTTTTDLAAIARYIGGKRAEVSSIATGREDPHHIAAKPSYMLAAHNADLWIRVGIGNRL